MAFDALAGYSAQLWIVARVSQAASTDYPDLSAAATEVVMAEFQKWSVDEQLESPKFVCTAAPINSEGVVGKLALSGGIGTYTVTIEGVYNADSDAGAATFARLKQGAFVSMHLFLQQKSAYGYGNVQGKIVSRSVNTDVNNTNSPTPFTLKIEVIGNLGDPGTIS